MFTSLSRSIVSEAAGWSRQRASASADEETGRRLPGLRAERASALAGPPRGLAGHRRALGPHLGFGRAPSAVRNLEAGSSVKEGATRPPLYRPYIRTTKSF